MKKFFYSSIAAIVLIIGLSLTANRVVALPQTETLQRIAPDKPRDTPYLAVVRVFTGADTPYLSFAIDPQLVYSQVNSVVVWIPGNIHVVISFMNKEGELISEEEYYFNSHG
ncbi:MAG: hypothetical protein U0X40_02105 [Ferruginibacter sp.]